MKRKQLITDLIQLTEHIKTETKTFQELDLATLNHKPNADTWSILECFEHLNRYGDYYLKEIEQRLLQASPAPAADTFKPGIIGNYFVELIKPQLTGMKKMKTATEMNPKGSKLSTTTLDRFLKQQDRLITLLKTAEKVNLTKVKTSITLTKWIKLRLGDTLRFVVHHNERHLLQAQRVMASLEELAA